MTDSVKVEMTQIDEENGSPISKVTCEWYGMDRDMANALSMGIADGVVSSVTDAAIGKAEMSGNGMVAEALVGIRDKVKRNPGAIR